MLLRFVIAVELFFMLIFVDQVITLLKGIRTVLGG